MELLIIIGIGGIVGALTRFIIGQTVGRFYFKPFPLGTFWINVTGSFLLGFSAAHIVGLPTTQVLFERYGFQIGFLGAYTTHSTFAYESIRLVESGEWKIFFLYLAGSASIGLLSCSIGYFIGGA